MEALASRTTIVSSKNPGAEYVLDDGKYGSIVDDCLFGNKLVELISDSDKRAEQERIGQKRAKYFSWNSVANKHLELYRQAILKFG